MKKLKKALLLVVRSNAKTTIIIILCIITVFQVECRPTGKILTIKQGDIKGKLSLTREGRIFVEYFGIPYAKEPKRFQKAGPPPKWKGIRDGSKKAPPCYHFESALLSMVGSENCLFLSVHTPSTHMNYYLKNLPVVVAIHGGQFVSHSGDMLGAKYLMDHDLVFISFNYRLGVLGFLTTGDAAVPANLGLRDQVLALEWVQDNVHFFGGDRKRVTLLGYNAGAAFVSYHMVSPMSKGLFNKAISQSGNLLCPWAFVDDPITVTERLAVKTGCGEVEDNKALVDCLTQKSAMELEAARLSLSDVFEDPLNPFGPVVEHWLREMPSQSAFLPHYPFNLWMQGNNTDEQAAIPWLTGVNNMDGLDRRAVDFLKDPMEELDETFDVFSPIYFGFGQKVGSNVSNITDQIRTFYFKSKNITRLQMVDALTDRNYLQCTKNAAIEHSKRADVFLYYLDYVGDYSLVDDLRSRKVCNVHGAMHSDELQYLFDLDELGDYPLIRRKFRPKSLKFSENLVRLWINFIKKGKPKSDWKPIPKNVHRSDLKWYKLGTKWKMASENFTKRIDFWDSLHLEGKKDLPQFNPRMLSKRRRGHLTTPKTVVDHNFDEFDDDMAYIDGIGDDDGSSDVKPSRDKDSAQESVKKDSKNKLSEMATTITPKKQHGRAIKKPKPTKKHKPTKKSKTMKKPKLTKKPIKKPVIKTTKKTTTIKPKKHNEQAVTTIRPTYESSEFVYGQDDTFENELNQGFDFDDSLQEISLHNLHDDDEEVVKDDITSNTAIPSLLNVTPPYNGIDDDPYYD